MWVGDGKQIINKCWPYWVVSAHYDELHINKYVKQVNKYGSSWLVDYTLVY